MSEIYFSIDVETTGHTPAGGSMISLGAAAFVSLEPVSTFYDKLKEPLLAKRNPSTMEWWGGYLHAWKEATSNPKDPAIVLKRFVDWVKKTSEDRSPVCVANPAAFDAMFLFQAIDNYLPLNSNPFGHRCLDIRSFIASYFNLPFYSATIVTAYQQMGESLPDDCGIPHIALDDAVFQGRSFMRILEYTKQNQLCR